MDGVLLVDKPSGPTSHDVVARLRSVTGERSVGHTGTLDPLASGLLPLVFGKATRLSAHLTGGDKTYTAVIQLGFATETDDSHGERIGGTGGAAPNAPIVERAEIERALARFRGTFAQMPPRHSAKKVGGKKAYDMARLDQPLALEPVDVTVKSLELTAIDGDRVSVTVCASAGFYVRALARDLGDALGCGAHIVELRRTGSGTFDIARALPLAEAERLGPAVSAHLLSPADALPELPKVTVTAIGLKRALHGNPLSPVHLEGRALPADRDFGSRLVRVLDSSGTLVALAHARGGALHPAVVLG